MWPPLEPPKRIARTHAPALEDHVLGQRLGPVLRHNVLPQDVLAHAAVAAHVAHEGRDVLVREHVFLERRRAGERLVAQRALVWLDACKTEEDAVEKLQFRKGEEQGDS